MHKKTKLLSASIQNVQIIMKHVTKMSPHVHFHPQQAVADFVACVLKLLSY